MGIFTGAVSEEDGVKCWVSYPGASYGGPAWSPKLQYHHLEELVRVLVEYARTAGFGQIRITPPPVIYNKYYEQSLDFALWRHGFKVIRHELSQAVRLEYGDDELIESFVNKSRTAYRQAIKHDLKFRIIDRPTGADLDRFWEILEENREGLGVTPAHNRREIETLHDLVPDDLMLGVVEHKGEIIAVIWNFLCNRHTVLEFYMAHEARFQALRPVPFLTYHTMKWAKRQGFRWLDFGISSIWGEPTWGLLNFKENFSSQHYLRLTHQLDLS